MWGLLLVSWPGQDGCCPQGTDGTQAGTSCLGAELYFLLDGHLSNCRVTASRTVELNHGWSPHSFYYLCLPIKSWLQISSHICPWATAEVPMCPWNVLKCWGKVLLRALGRMYLRFARSWETWMKVQTSLLCVVLVPEAIVPFVGLALHIFSYVGCGQQVEAELCPSKVEFPCSAFCRVNLYTWQRDARWEETKTRKMHFFSVYKYAS